MSRRLARALRNFVVTERDRREVGRLPADLDLIASADRPDYVNVIMNRGGQTLVLNKGPGRVALRANLPVRVLRRADGELIMDGEDDRLLENDSGSPGNPYGVPTHPLSIHSDVTITATASGDVLAHNGTAWVDETPVATSAGAADAGKLMRLDAAGQVDASMINDADINLDSVTEGATNKFYTATEQTKLAGIEAGADVTDVGNVASSIHAGTSKPTPDAADEWPYLNSVAAAWNLVKITTTELITWLSTLFVVLAGKAGGQVVYGGTAAGEDLTLDSTSHATKGDLILQPGGGNTGIGIAPLYKFHIAEAQDGAEMLISVENTIATAGSLDELAGIQFLHNNGGAAKIVAGKYEDFVGSANRTGFLAFYTRLNGAWNEWMRIAAGGEVAIGVTSPQGRLHVYDGVGNNVLLSKTGIVGSEIEVLAVGEVAKGVYLRSLGWGSAGGIDFGSVTIQKPGAGSTTAATASGFLALRLYSTGRLMVVRNSGTETWTATFDIVYQ